MCELCKIKKKLSKESEVIENAGTRYSVKLQEFKLLVRESRNEEAEALRVEIHAQTDIILDSVATSKVLIEKFKVAIKEGPGSFLGGMEH